MSGHGIEPGSRARAGLFDFKRSISFSHPTTPVLRDLPQTTAAIVYSKLMRLLAKAHVTFSSTLCVQYGKGNEGSTVRFGQLNFRASVAPALLKTFSASDLLADDEDDQDATEDGFPVMEFVSVPPRGASSVVRAVRASARASPSHPLLALLLALLRAVRSA
jgi:hypothetical protein